MKSKVVNITLIVVAFTLTAAVIIYMLPRRTSNFAYYFEQGKPWGYELLTAEQDFPVYKTDAELSAEREQVLKNYTPFFNIDTQIEEKVIGKLQESEGWQKLSKRERERIATCLVDVYKAGVMSATDMERLQAEGWQNLKLIDSKHVASQKRLGDIYTPKTAYAAVVESMHKESSARHLELNAYIEPNLYYDSTRSEKLYQDMVSSVSLTRGIVQQGERIVDRGEIVTAETYQILLSLRMAADEKNVDEQQSWLQYAGMALLVVILLGMLVLYLSVFRPLLLADWRNVVFICLLTVMLFLVAALILRFSSFSIYVVPFALVPMMLRVFYDSRTAFFCHLITVLLVALLLPFSFTFVLIQTAVGLVTVVSLKDVSVRAQLVTAAALVFLTQSVVYTACFVATAGAVSGIEWQTYLYFFASALLLLPVYGLIYLSERSFGFTSALTLVELTNVNSGILLEFAQCAPGTFQHSLQVSNLATEAAKRIGANALLVRVGALYHDIGKMSKPEYFTENQQDGLNPLNQMTEQAAAEVIISHVTEGLRMAHRRRLPSVITAFIGSHHGTSKVRYFYNKYVNQHPDEVIDESKFCYPGPKPQTKETGILMMADAVEARSRSLSVVTEASIREMVEQMVGQQIADGELSETPLSLKDVEDIKQVFCESLCTMYHHRIAYPDLKQQPKK